MGFNKRIVMNSVTGCWRLKVATRNPDRCIFVVVPPSILVYG